MNKKEAALDTSILIDYFKFVPEVRSRFGDFDYFWIPVPVIAEMEFGFIKVKNQKKCESQFRVFLSNKDVRVLAAGEKAARIFAGIKYELMRVGAMIPINDIWIAACCLADNKLLVSRDSHFQRVSGLHVEIW